MTDRRFEIGETALWELLTKAMTAKAPHAMRNEPAVLVNASGVADAVLASLSESAQEPSPYVPHQWRCSTCGFVASKMLLRASDGAVGIDTREVHDICPNDGTSLVRVTWEEAAVEHGDRALTEMKRADAAEQCIAQLEAERGATPAPLTDEQAKVLGEQNAALAAEHGLDLASLPPLPVAPAPSGWQPIESAPKEHKRVVMLYGEEFGRRVWMRGYYFKGVPGDGEGWITSILYSEPHDDWHGSGPQPTHWMPLPPALTQEHTS